MILLDSIAVFIWALPILMAMGLVALGVYIVTRILEAGRRDRD